MEYTINDKSFKRKASDRWSQKNKDKYKVGNIYVGYRTSKGVNCITKDNHTKELKAAILEAL